MTAKINQTVLIVLLFVFGACQNTKQVKESKLQVIATSDRQWTGIAVSHEGRVFVNYPKWSDNVPISVAEIVDGKTIAYPNADWNNSDNQDSFTAVQSVVIDDKDRLWILDTKNPQFIGVLESGPVLYQFNPKSNQKEKAYTFPKGVFTANSYFNDVRVDTNKEIAYLTDSGNGAIIVLDLKSGKSRRLLDHHPSTESEVDYLICDNQNWKNSVHSDGIALSPDRNYLYYTALTGHTLYKIPTTNLLNEQLSNKQIVDKVQKVMAIPATDGMLFDKKGNLWLGGLENNSINKINTNGELVQLIQDKRIRWADSFAEDKDGNIYFTTSQIHLPENLRQSYDIIRFNPKQLTEQKKSH
ncbi:MAG: SMP-30/gluconolactonase/LRE family protein [Labilibaculum sp.]|nr:SMP-30/gluconolactonase/LRE family protein [Labilibaculum sp.]